MNSRIPEKLHNASAAWVILVLSIVLTGSAWYLARHFAKQRAMERFEFSVQDAQERILRRVADYEQILRGGVAFFDASSDVTREDWKRFVQDLEINKHFPGLQGMGYTIAFSPEQKERIEDWVKSDGFPSFAIYPEGKRELMTSIVFLEPFDVRNRRAFGYDMYSEETRRAAMDYALRSGKPGITGKVVLLQETNEDVQPGFLMYLPVYRARLDELNSADERRRSLRGFVYSPFRMNDFMRGILGSGNDELNFKIFDGDAVIESAFLFELHPHDPSLTLQESRFRAHHQLELGNHRWTVVFESTEAFEKAVATLQPNVIGVGGILVDILLFLVIMSLVRTRRLAELRSLEIADAQQLYKGIVDGCPDGFWVCDKTGRLLEVNPAYCELSGYEESELIGQNIDFLEEEFDRPEIELRKQETIQNGWMKFETRHRGKDGTVWPVGVMISYWPQQGGRFFVFCRNISNRLESEKSLIEAKQHAELANQAKSDFLANMSHEIRTPMNAILGLTQLAMEMDLPDEARGYLKNSVQGSRALLGLLNDILDYSKIEAGRMELSPDWLRLDELLFQVRNLYRVQAEQSGIELQIMIETSCPKRIYGDALKISQVLNNLVGNALKFSNEGLVRIEVQLVSMHQEKAELHFVVSDQGIGISEDKIKLLFEPFVQADSSITRSFGGTGLGLSICRRLVDLMGGSMGVESKPGVGSQFHFNIQVGCDPDSCGLQLDQSFNAEGDTGWQSEYSDTTFRGVHILIGEDNRMNQVIARRLLERRGAKVSVAGDGKAVLRALEMDEFDLILLDLQMPMMGGLDCATQIRQMDEPGGSIPIVAMTAAVSQEDRDACVKVGMNGFIGKPFERDQLLGEVHRLVSDK